MAAPTGPTLYVWRRNTEVEPSRWVWWAVGGIVALSGFGAFAAYMAENGEESTFIALGVIGSVLIWSIPRVYGWGRRRHPDILMEGREMVWSKLRVPIDQVESWRVGRSTTYFSNGTTIGRSTLGYVRFTLFDGEERTFSFPHLTEAEVADLSSAIEPILPGRRLD